ncbi:hypothetical protein ACWIGW_42560 [Nocardia brasiliensis]
MSANGIRAVAGTTGCTGWSGRLGDSSGGIERASGPSFVPRRSQVIAGPDSEINLVPEERAIGDGERWVTIRCSACWTGCSDMPRGHSGCAGSWRRTWHERRASPQGPGTSPLRRRSRTPAQRNALRSLVSDHAYELLGSTVGYPGAYRAWDFLAVTLLAPNVFRTFCLHFVSSNVHYYSDVEPHNVLRQTQVWTARWPWPVHALCFNFGGTHAIHQFVVRDPVFTREAIRVECRTILREHCGRFNDFGAFRRTNRFGLAAALPGAVRP